MKQKFLIEIETNLISNLHEKWENFEIETYIINNCTDDFGQISFKIISVKEITDAL